MHNAEKNKRRVCNLCIIFFFNKINKIVQFCPSLKKIVLLHNLSDIQKISISIIFILLIKKLVQHYLQTIKKLCIN